jgi:hypothetical protein
MKTVRTILVLIFLAIGLCIFLDDLSVRRRYGVDVNDVAAIDPYWGPIDWPTGERPVIAMVPAFTYSFVFWLVAVAFARPPAKRYHARIHRGTE